MVTVNTFGLTYFHFFFLRVAEILDRTEFHGLLTKEPTEASKVMQAIVIAFGYPPE